MKPEVQKVLDYLDSEIDLFQLEEHLLGLLDVSEGRALNRQLTGLLAEASHANWDEGGIREELAAAIFPFLSVARFGEPSQVPAGQFDVEEEHAIAIT